MSPKVCTHCGTEWDESLHPHGIKDCYTVQLQSGGADGAYARGYRAGVASERDHADRLAAALARSHDVETGGPLHKRGCRYCRLLAAHEARRKGERDG